ncbi:GNAT family N-acetyltransferase [Chelativorans salis]|uniref:GNAT family N-acetyltransferase n=1 Tax=Chelativorans salis TaxID=2978478 RepID=A0ABT2LVU1_9HYPH|nr:GNAT family N-acetyltransferase [Chelativorans sp. EGI FJ00035]MCT7378655.1 GNAT family N-acetyltransferase [Chelativorans sp. EGI FJ00035]
MSYPLTALMPRDCIRPALQEEAGEIARLFLISSDGLAAYIWSKMDMQGLSLEEIGTARYARTNTAFSFENCLVAVRGYRIAGMVHAFPMEADASGVEETDPVLRPYAELEDPGSLYVSGLAVHDRYRGRGIGGELMDHVYAVARSRGLPRVSLICFERNETAFEFYRKRGFQEIARRPVVPHRSLHDSDGDAVLMVRDCSSTAQVHRT